MVSLLLQKGAVKEYLEVNRWKRMKLAWVKNAWQKMLKESIFLGNTSLGMVLFSAKCKFAQWQYRN